MDELNIALCAIEAWRNQLPPSAADELSTNDKKRTTFLDLSAELRNDIYHLALIMDTYINLQLNVFGRIPLESKEPGLLRASSQVRAEALPIYYDGNVFLMNMCGTRFLNKSILPSTMAMFRHVRLRTIPFRDVSEVERVLTLNQWGPRRDAVWLPLPVWRIEKEGRQRWASQKGDVVLVSEGEKHTVATMRIKCKDPLELEPLEAGEGFSEEEKAAL